MPTGIRESECSPPPIPIDGQPFTWGAPLKPKLVRQNAFYVDAATDSGLLKRAIDEEEGEEGDDMSAKKRFKAADDDEQQQHTCGEVEAVQYGPKTLIDMLFDLTLEYIQSIVENDPDSTLTGVLREITDKKSFVKTVYERSKSAESTDALFWTTIKALTVGSSHSIDLGNTIGSVTKESMTPVQFGGFKRDSAGGGPSPFYQAFGEYGERWVGDQLALKKEHYVAPGKFCKSSFPLATTTPDFVFFTGDGDCPRDAPVAFAEGAVVGIGEVKSSHLPAAHRPIWKNGDVTVRDLFSEKSAMIRNIVNWNTDKPSGRLPRRLKEHADLCDVISRRAAESIRWSMWYFDDTEDESELRIERDFDPAVEGNSCNIKLLSTVIGRQMLCEAMSVLDYVKEGTEKIGINAYFPSVYDKNRVPAPRERVFDEGEEEEEDDDGGDDEEVVEKEVSPYFVTAFCVNCTMEVSVADLKRLSGVVDGHLADAMYEVARARYLL